LYIASQSQRYLEPVALSRELSRCTVSGSGMTADIVLLICCEGFSR